MLLLLLVFRQFPNFTSAHSGSLDQYLLYHLDMPQCLGKKLGIEETQCKTVTMCLFPWHDLGNDK